MKPGAQILTLFLFFLVLTCCKNKNEACPVCGVDDPIENLPWLNSTIMLYTAADFQSLKRVDLYEFNTEQLLLFSWQLKGIEDAPTGAVYGCDGEIKYSCGGNQLFDSCSYIIGRSKYIRNIWDRKNN